MGWKGTAAEGESCSEVPRRDDWKQPRLRTNEQAGVAHLCHGPGGAGAVLVPVRVGEQGARVAQTPREGVRRVGAVAVLECDRGGGHDAALGDGAHGHVPRADLCCPRQRSLQAARCTRGQADSGACVSSLLCPDFKEECCMLTRA